MSLFSNLARWLREPLLHFLLIGGALFLVWDRYRPPEVTADAVPPVSRRITVSEAKLIELMRLFEQNQGHLPSHAELTAAADEWTRDEILSRSALLAGLDRNDPVIRQRLAKLMQWYLTGSAQGGEPSDDEMRRYFEENHERFRTAQPLVFEQIFFSTAKRGPTALTDARTTLDSFRAGKQTGVEVAIGHGDSLGGDRSEEETQRGTPDELAAKFGLPFIDKLQQLAMEQWSGPLASPSGWHVVRRRRSENPTFDELRLRIRSELLAQRGKLSPENGYEELSRRYEVERANLPAVEK